MPRSTVISLGKAFDKLTFVGDRTPTSTEKEIGQAFAELAPFGEGAIFIGHYAGNSEWERHSRGDEIVYVLEGETTLILLADGGESAHVMRAGDFLIVPRNTWHRFVTPQGVRIMTATPQPTDHSIDHPGA